MVKVIEAYGLGKSYGGKIVLKEVDLSVGQGEIFGVLGANGAGKSTLVECLVGTRVPDEGTAMILGQNVRTNRQRLFERVGVQFQDNHCQEHITVAELCREMAALYRKPADWLALLQRFGLSGQVKQTVSQLSGGQRQRLFIVLALLPQPEVLFLDELTTGLDTQARQSVWRQLADLKTQGVSIFLTSHYMDEVEKLCDRIAILRQGQLVFCGTVAEAIAASPYQTLEDAYLWYSGEEGQDERFSDVV